jgi:DNA-binding transcriptional LysR family regulator
MEMNEVRYFLAVAKTENMHKASLDIGVSAGSLSKAISKLESELHVKLFTRVGRNIVLTEYGKFLKQKGHDLLGLETSIKSEIMGQENTIKVTVGGSEVLLSSFGVSLSKDINKYHQSSMINFSTTNQEDLISKVRDGEIDIGISTYDLPSDFDQKNISSITFNTYISDAHPLGRKSKKGPVDIKEILKYRFVVPQNNILGRINKSDSSDGWRDDKFPRIISYFSSSLKTIENLVLEGEAIAYLPDYFGEKSNMLRLDISGCPYYCKQKVKIFTRDKKKSGLLNNLF